jgi:hypothetical protein
MVFEPSGPERDGLGEQITAQLYSIRTKLPAHQIRPPRRGNESVDSIAKFAAGLIRQNHPGPDGPLGCFVEELLENGKGERPEVFMLAVGICALDAGDALGVVAAANELFHHLDDTHDSESAIDDRVFVFILMELAKLRWAR